MQAREAVLEGRRFANKFGVAAQRQDVGVHADREPGHGRGAEGREGGEIRGPGRAGAQPELENQAARGERLPVGAQRPADAVGLGVEGARERGAGVGTRDPERPRDAEEDVAAADWGGGADAEARADAAPKYFHGGGTDARSDRPVAERVAVRLRPEGAPPPRHSDPQHQHQQPPPPWTPPHALSREGSCSRARLIGGQNTLK